MEKLANFLQTSTVNFEILLFLLSCHFYLRRILYCPAAKICEIISLAISNQHFDHASTLLLIATA